MAPTIRQGTEQRSRRIESVRALAALAVVQYHTLLLAVIGRHPYSHLDVTVALWGISPIYVFFGLSGYLIFRPFARRDYGGGGPVKLSSYALNRVVRLLPIYYVAITVLLIIDQASSGDWWRFMLFAQSYSTQTIGRIDGPTWTLVIELQFYIALPLLAWLLVRLSRGSARGAVLLLIAIGACSYAYYLHVRNPVLHPLAHWQFPANFVFIVAGMIIGIVEARWSSLRTERLPRWATSSGVWLILGLVIWPLTSKAYVPAGSAALVASFLIIGSVVLPLRPSRLVSWLDWRPLATLGIATYSLYIWHYPLVQGLVHIHLLDSSFPVDAVLGMAISAAVALVSYRVIEAPFLGLRRRWAPTTAEAASAAASTPDSSGSPTGTSQTATQ